MARGGPSGCRDTNMIQDLGPTGMRVALRRPLAARLLLPPSPPAAATAGAPANDAASAASASASASAAAAATAELLPDASLPPIQVAVSLPRVVACVGEREYTHALAVLAENFSETLGGGGGGGGGVDPVGDLFVRRRLYDKYGASRRRPPPPPPAAAANKTAGSAAGAASSAFGDGGGSAVSARPPPLDFRLSTRAAMALLSPEADACAVQVTVSIGLAALTLLVPEVEGGAVLRPLAAVAVRDLWAGYYATSGGSMFLSLALPSATIEDARPGVLPDQRLVLSTSVAGVGASSGAVGMGEAQPATPSAASASSAEAPWAPAQMTQHPQSAGEGGAPNPSLLVVEFRSIAAAATAATAAAAAASPGSTAAAKPRLPSIGIRIRVQQPQMVLDLLLLQRLINFAAGGPVLQGAVPRAFDGRDVHVPLGHPGPHSPYTARGGADLWLCPEVRLLADAPAALATAGKSSSSIGSGGGNGSGDSSSGGQPRVHVYDGGGGRLVLPPGLAAAEALPLVVVGAGRTLVLRNVRVINAASLPACLQLGPGAKLVAREEDGVKMIAGGGSSSVVASAASMAGGARPSLYGAAAAGAAAAAAAAAAGGSGSDGTGSTAAAGAVLPPYMELAVDVVGASVHVMDSPAGAEGTAYGGAGAGAGAGLATATSLAASARSGSSVSVSVVGRSRAGAARSSRFAPSHLGSRPAAMAAPLAGRGAATMAPDDDEEEDELDEAATVGRGGGGGWGGRLRRRLVIAADLSASWLAVGDSKQEARAALRGLSVRMLTSLRSSGGGGGAGGGGGVDAFGLLRAQSRNSLSGAALHRAPSIPETASGYGDGTTTVVGGRGGGGGGLGGDGGALDSVLMEAADITLTYELTVAEMALSVDADSALLLRLTPQAAALLLRLQARLLARLSVPAPNQPLSRCSRYQPVCSLATAATAAAGGWSGGGAVRGARGFAGLGTQPTAGGTAANPSTAAGTGLNLLDGSEPSGTSGGSGATADAQPLDPELDPEAAARGLTIWRPVASSGYVPLGDVICQGNVRPLDSVVTASISSVRVGACVGAQAGRDDMMELAFPTTPGVLWLSKQLSRRLS